MARSRAAAFVVFLLTGAVFGTWAARIPAVQDRLHLSAGALAVALGALEGGAVVGLPLGGALVARTGSVRCLRVGFAIYPPALVVAAVAPELGTLLAGLLVMACANSVIDVAMNVQGAELERREGRPLLAGLHAGHSLGALAGGAGGAVAAAAGIALLPHFVAVAALAAAGAIAATSRLPGESAPIRGHRSRPRLDGRLAGLGLAASCALFVESVGNSWSAVQLRRMHSANPAVAAAGFTAFTLALVVARLATDPLVRRIGRRRSICGAGAVVVAGSMLVMLAPTTASAIGGWVLVGAGVAGVAPTVLGAVGPDARSIATVTTIGYLGSFAGPPLIGSIAMLAGLSTALLAPAVAGLLLAAFSPRRRRAPAGDPRRRR